MPRRLLAGVAVAVTTIGLHASAAAQERPDPAALIAAQKEAMALGTAGHMSEVPSAIDIAGDRQIAHFVLSSQRRLGIVAPAVIGR